MHGLHDDKLGWILKDSNNGFHGSQIDCNVSVFRQQPDNLVLLSEQYSDSQLCAGCMSPRTSCD